VEIKGSRDSVEELDEIDKETLSPGHGYIVNGRLYVWDGENWNDVGEIKGPKGDKGDTGEQGLQGPKGDKGDKGEDGSLTAEQEELLAKLSKWYDDSHYVKMTGTFSMSPNTSTYEMGVSKDVTYSWSFSKKPIEVKFDDVAVDDAP
jgi:hypothetical protein